MINDAHSGMTRCLRARETVRRLIGAAHRMGVRHMAMEALTTEFAANANESREVPPASFGYLSQLEMRRLIQDTLTLGWRLIAYEADLRECYSDNGQSAMRPPAKPTNCGRDGVQMDFAQINWRMERQARNLTEAIRKLPVNEKILVIPGNLNFACISNEQVTLMGCHFRSLSGIEAFCLDQTVTVHFHAEGAGRKYSRHVERKYRRDLLRFGGTAGVLVEEAPASLTQRCKGVHALILSLENELE